MRKYILFVLFAALGAFVLLGCSSAAKIRKAQDIFDEHKQEAAEYCAAAFPPLNSVEILPGTVTIDTVYADRVISVPYDCPASDTVRRVQVIIDTKYQTVTKHVRDTIREVKVNTAAVEAQTIRANEATERASKYEALAKKRGKFITWFWVAVAASVVAGGVYVYMKFKTAGIV